MRAAFLAIVLCSSCYAADPTPVPTPTPAPIPTTIAVTLTDDQAAAVQALVALSGLNGQPTTPAQAVQMQVDRWLAAVRAESLKERQQRRKIDAALAPYYKLLDAELDKGAEK